MENLPLIPDIQREVVGTAGAKQTIYFYKRLGDLTGVSGVKLTHENFESTLHQFERQEIQNLLVSSAHVTGWRVNCDNGEIEVVLLGSDWEPEEVVQAQGRVRSAFKALTSGHDIQNPAVADT